MLDYSSLRNVFKATDRINSKHLVLAEWNMNKYQTIERYGIYVPTPPLTTSYVSTDGNISSGENYLIYDDGSTKLQPNQEYFSQLASVFKPNRPDPGIILTQFHKNIALVKNASALKRANLNPYQDRYYLFSEHRKYDYFNSAKTLVTSSGFTMQAVSNPTNGTISGANPFVIYENTFPCNKITIKVQNHMSVPVEFSIEILQGSTWVTAYSKTQSSSADFSATGVLNIYYDPTTSSWVKVTPNTDIGRYVVNDLTQLDNLNPTELKRIKGIRLTVYKMSLVTTTKGNFPAPLELIEISPRVEADVSDYTEGFTFNSSIGDSTNFGLPVGSVVAGTGNLTLSNEKNLFLFTSALKSLGMLSPDVKFLFYQLITPPGDVEKAIPLKVMYSVEWNVQQDYSATIQLEDGFKYLRETSAPDLLFNSSIGIPISVIILFLLDNAGITNYEFKKTDNLSDKQDTLIRSFFSQKEQTIAEVLEELAVASQCAMYYDAVGNLSVLTKERLTEKVGKTDSTSSTVGTDFWMILDEDYTINGSNATEYSQISAYRSNVVTYSEQQLNPVTDGDIVYHTYGPPKQPRLDEFPEQALNRLLENTTFPASLAFTNYGYNTSIAWTAAEGDDGAMGAANLMKTLNSTRLKDLFPSISNTFNAADEDEAVRAIYAASTGTQKLSYIMYLDPNEGLTINPYSGMVLIGNEFIKYNGKLVLITSPNSIGTPVSTEKILFSREEFLQEIRNIGTGGSVKLLGLVVDFEFQITAQTDSQYTYKIIGDGRGKLGSQAQTHYAGVEEFVGLNSNLRYGLSLGSSYNRNFPTPQVTIKNNFLERTRYKSAYRALQKKGLLDKFSSQSYLGFMKISGIANDKDKSTINKLFSGEGNSDVADELKEINKQTDDSVPGNFDDFIFLAGERNIYGQKIQIPFSPNIISTRMRLFSPRKKLKNQYLTMETLSSIAGIAFNVNQYGEGYYLEVEGVASGKSNVASEAFKNNLRFYKVTIKEGVFEPRLIFAAPVAAYTTSNIDVQVLKNDKAADPYFDLTVIIDRPRNGDLIRYTIRYGDTRVGQFVESRNDAVAGTSTSLFVRGDSQAIFEYISAGARPVSSGDRSLFKSYNRIDDKVRSGILPLDQQLLYKDENILYYFNDFAKLVREVKDYDIRFTYPAFSSALLDVSKINPQYMVKKYSPTPFGAKLIVANTSSGPIVLTEQSNTPLYIAAIAMEELTTGTVNMDDTYDKIDEKKRRVVDNEKNKALYGLQTFTIDSQYMQSMSQAKDMMRWIIRYCNRPRVQLSMEVFANPLLELGDKVKVYDKSRGYYEQNEHFGNKTFTVSSITYSVNTNGPVMNVDIIEVGQ